jgi:hypothetical protein
MDVATLKIPFIILRVAVFWKATTAPNRSPAPAEQEDTTGYEKITHAMLSFAPVIFKV